MAGHHLTIDHGGVIAGRREEQTAGPGREVSGQADRPDAELGGIEQDEIAGHTGLYVAREPDEAGAIWSATTARREPLERVDRSWRGVVMDTYALEKLTGWTPELSPPPGSPLFGWRELAGDIEPIIVADNTGDRDKRPDREIFDHVDSHCRDGAIDRRHRATG